jgi:hypothetical protein
LAAAATAGRVLARAVSVFFAAIASIDGRENHLKPPVTPTRRPDDYRP